MDPPPSDCAHVWEWFSELLLTRQIGVGDNPITYHEIDAYCRLTGARMEPWEARAVVSVYWAYCTARGKPKSRPGTEIRNETDIGDGAGVKALMAGFGAKSSKNRSIAR